MTQLPMFAGGSERELTQWEHILEEHVKPGVAAVTLKEYAFRCDAKPSNMSDALAERDHKRLGAEQLIMLLRILPEANRVALLEAIAKPLGYRVERVVTLTPDEALRKAREYMRINAPGLLPGLDKEIGR